MPRYDYGGLKPTSNNPGQYPFVGDAYIGELPGYVYDPYQNLYVPDPRVQNEYYEQHGLKEDEDDKAGLTDSIMPIAAVAGTYGLAQSFANNPGAWGTALKDGWNAVTGGNAAAQAAQGAQTAQAAQGAQAAATGAEAAGSVGTWGAQAASDYNTISGLYDSAANLGGQPAATAGTPWFDVGGPSYAGYLGAAGSVATGAMNWDDWGKRGDDYRNTRIAQQVGEAVGNYFTGGLASLANQGLRAIAPHFMNEVDEFLTQYGPVGILTRAFGSKKGEDQLKRDAWRNNLQYNNFTDDNDLFTFGDGATFDFGLDGGARLANAGANIDGLSDRRYHDVDFSNQQAVDLIGVANALALLDAGTDTKMKADAAGSYINAATTTGGDPRARMMEIVQRRAGGHGQAYAAIHELQQKKLISDEEANAAKNALDEFYQTGAYAPGGAAYGLKSKPPAIPASESPKPEGGTMGMTPQRSPIQGRPAPEAAAARGAMGLGGPVRISPGVWKDERGEYLSKTGARGR